MKLLIVAGGGGHFMPALALIEALPKDVDVLVVGRKHTFEGDQTESFEYQTAKRRAIPFVAITTGRLQRRITKHSLFSLFKVPVGYAQALRVVKGFRPDIVLSFGGYVSLPVALAAKTLGVPIIVHEQVLGGGLSNKIVAKFADKVCLSWEESARFFPKEKVVVTGNPMRRIEHSEFKMQEALPVLYVTGGSGGAHAINVLLEACLKNLLQKYIVVHQTGDAKEFEDFERLEKKKAALPSGLQSRYIVQKFIEPEKVFGVLQKADLIVARAGINTVTEVLLYGKPCLFIPLPYGQHNEQLTNALYVKQTGIAEVADQKQLTGEKLEQLITTMMEKISSYKERGVSARKRVKENGTDNLLAVIHDVNQKKKIT